MAEKEYSYIIVGGGVTGASAVGGIRENDRQGSILLIGEEAHLPYNRPPLSKQLWWGDVRPEDIFVQAREYYSANGVDLLLGRKIISLDPERKTVTDDQGKAYRYGKLLLATGGVARRLPLPGADLPGIIFYRCLDDYSRLRDEVKPGSRVTMIGGGFIGAELAASLAGVGARVTMVYPEATLCAKVLPSYLGESLQKKFADHGVRIVNHDKPASFQERSGMFVTRTQAGKEIISDHVVVGIGILPLTALAESAGVTVNRGIIVNEFQQSSNPDIFAAGDNAVFPYLAIGRQMRVEHWDHAVNHGTYAGRNMSGSRAAYDYMPNFFSDMFDVSYQGVGELGSNLRSIPDWKEENERGTIYFLREGRLNGAIILNIPGDIDQAREFIRKGVVPEHLRAEALQT